MLTSVFTKATSMLALALFSFGVMAARDVASNAPALNEELAHPSITGDVRVGVTSDMYDESKYRMQIGYGYLNADSLVFAEIESRTEIAPLELAQLRMDTARAHFQRSITLDPANGIAWVFYAQTLAAVGTPQEAGDALRQSWKLVPHNARFAFTRLSIIETLRDQMDDKDAFADIVSADLAVLEQKAPRALELIDL